MLDEEVRVEVGDIISFLCISSAKGLPTFTTVGVILGIEGSLGRVLRKDGEELVVDVMVLNTSYDSCDFVAKGSKTAYALYLDFDYAKGDFHENNKNI